MSHEDDEPVGALKPLMKIDPYLLAKIFSYCSAPEVLRKIVLCCRQFKDLIYSNLGMVVQKLVLSGDRITSRDLTHPAFAESFPRKVALHNIVDNEVQRFIITNQHVKNLVIVQERPTDLSQMLEDRIKKTPNSELEKLWVVGNNLAAVNFSHPVLAKLVKLSISPGDYTNYEPVKGLPVHHMKSLDLFGITADSQLFTNISQMKLLEKLTLQACKLTEFPLLNLPNLTSLDLRSCKQLSAVPDISGFPKLRHLNLASTNIKSYNSTPNELIDFVWKPLAEQHAEAYEFKLHDFQVRYAVVLPDGKCHIGLAYITVLGIHYYAAAYMPNSFFSSVHYNKNHTEMYLVADVEQVTTVQPPKVPEKPTTATNWLHKLLFPSKKKQEATQCTTIQSFSEFKVVKEYTQKLAEYAPPHLQPITGYSIDNRSKVAPPPAEDNEWY